MKNIEHTKFNMFESIEFKQLERDYESMYNKRNIETDKVFQLLEQIKSLEAKNADLLKEWCIQAVECQELEKKNADLIEHIGE
tara:strand:- start:365 stop:613 length:249 start_codon:yes stop_codon:yes gene_type:complete